MKRSTIIRSVGSTLFFLDAMFAGAMRGDMVATYLALLLAWLIGLSQGIASEMFPDEVKR